MNLEYDTIRMLWWALQVLAVLGLIMYDGLILGTGILLNAAGKTGPERQGIIALIAPNWLGKQAWLLAAITILFAASPITYAVLLSSLQPLILLMLPAWLIRPSVFFCGHDCKQQVRRDTINRTFSYLCLIACILLGLICGNVLKGIPFHLDNDMRIFFLGNFRELLNPFSLLVAGVSVSLMTMYGAQYLQLNNCNPEMYQRCKAVGKNAGLAFLILFVLAGLWVSRLEGYHINSELIPNSASNPFNKFVRRGEGLWLDNYEHQPTLWVIPGVAFTTCGLTLYLSKLNRNYWAFLASCVSLAMSVLTVAVSMFPFILPSNRSLNSSLTLWDATASAETLSILFWIAIVAIPLMAVSSRIVCRLMSSTKPME